MQVPQAHPGVVSTSGAGHSSWHPLLLNPRLPGVRSRGPWLRTCSFLAMLGSIACIAQDSHPPGGAFRPDRAAAATAINQPPDLRTQTQLNHQREEKFRYEAANAERKRQLADDSARLLQLAADLKSELEKAPDLAALIQKAETIEKLAHGVKDKMRFTVGAS